MLNTSNGVRRIQFGGPDDDRYRIHWFNLVLGVILIIASATAMGLYDHNHELYTGWSLLGLVIVGVGLAILLVLWLFDSVPFGSMLGFALGVVVTIAALLLFSTTDVSFKAMFMGIVTFFVIGSCLVGLTLTRWWRPE